MMKDLDELRDHCTLYLYNSAPPRFFTQGNTRLEWVTHYLNQHQDQTTIDSANVLVKLHFFLEQYKAKRWYQRLWLSLTQPIWSLKQFYVIALLLKEIERLEPNDTYYQRVFGALTNAQNYFWFSSNTASWLKSMHNIVQGKFNGETSHMLPGERIIQSELNAKQKKIPLSKASPESEFQELMIQATIVLQAYEKQKIWLPWPPRSKLTIATQEYDLRSEEDCSAYRQLLEIKATIRHSPERAEDYSSNLDPSASDREYRSVYYRSLLLRLVKCITLEGKEHNEMLVLQQLLKEGTMIGSQRLGSTLFAIYSNLSNQIDHLLGLSTTQPSVSAGHYDLTVRLGQQIIVSPQKVPPAVLTDPLFTSFPMSKHQEACRTLDLDPGRDITWSEIKTAYKEKAREVHPDKGKQDEKEINKIKFIAVNEAYKTLEELKNRLLGHEPPINSAIEKDEELTGYMSCYYSQIALAASVDKLRKNVIQHGEENDARLVAMDKEMFETIENSLNKHNEMYARANATCKRVEDAFNRSPLAAADKNLTSVIEKHENHTENSSTTMNKRDQLHKSDKQPGNGSPTNFSIK